MKRGVLLIRADATVTSGTGHVMRCLALAQAWQDAGGHVILVMAQSTPAIQERLQFEGVETVAIEAIPGSADDLRQTIATVSSHNSEWLVTDGYCFDSHYLAGLHSVGRLLVVDDNGELELYPADLVLNQNVHARADMYPKRSPRARLLLGSRYTLLRNEFVGYRDWTRKVREHGTRVLLTIGGSDPKDLTPRILASVAALPIDDLLVRVVVGGSAENHGAVAEQAAKFPGRVAVLSSVENMAELMAWADIAIAGAGTTCWEMCRLGLPAILVVVAKNQQVIAHHLGRLGVSINVGPSESLDYTVLGQTALALLENEDRRRQMSESSMQLVDGMGRERVRAALLDRELKLRLAGLNDSRLLFEWAKDPAARAASFRSAGISWDGHVRWFDERLRDSRSVIYIGERSHDESDGTPVGVVRFQIQDEQSDRRAVVSVNVAPEFRGEGWGRELILFSTRALVRSRSVRCIDAFVKPENHASIRLFEASGFRRVGGGVVSGQDALRFTWECGNRSHVD